MKPLEKAPAVYCTPGRVHIVTDGKALVMSVDEALRMSDMLRDSAIDANVAAKVLANQAARERGAT